MLQKNLDLALEAINYVREKLIFGSNTLKDSKRENWDPIRILKLRKEFKKRAYLYAMANNGYAGFDFISKLNHEMSFKK